MQDRVYDALSEFDESTLPPALQSGDSLLHVRGGSLNKYNVLSSFRRVRITRVRDLSDASLPRPSKSARANDPSQTEKIKLLSDLLARLERMVDASPRTQGER